MNIEDVIRKNKGDVQTYLALKSLNDLPFATAQGILVSVGRNVIQDVIDNTEITHDLVKRHFEGAINLYKEVADV